MRQEASQSGGGFLSGQSGQKAFQGVGEEHQGVPSGSYARSKAPSTGNWEQTLEPPRGGLNPSRLIMAISRPIRAAYTLLHISSSQGTCYPFKAFPWHPGNRHFPDSLAPGVLTAACKLPRRKELPEPEKNTGENAIQFKLYKFTLQAKSTACPISLSCLITAGRLIYH